MPTNEFWKIHGEGEWGTLLSLQYEKRVHGKYFVNFYYFLQFANSWDFFKKKKKINWPKSDHLIQRELVI